MLSSLKAYYVYTKEGNAQEDVHVDFAIPGITSITAEIHEGFIEIGFTEAAGILVTAQYYVGLIPALEC